VLALVLAHFVAAIGAPALVSVLGRRAFLLLALVPAAAVGWAVVRSGAVADSAVQTEVVRWVPTLGLDLAFAMGSLQWVMILVVAGVGALVLVYCTWYFVDEEAGLAAFAGHFVAFAGAMLGLVLADDLLLLYVFWELTTVFSYLLIGHDPTKRAGRAAGLQALIVTTFGGLAMLVGILLVGTQAGTLRITELLADPPSGATVTVAILLVLLGAVSKSALFPFHFWLPAAMAAPTPVSAYLHAAAMVTWWRCLRRRSAGCPGGTRCCCRWGCSRCCWAGGGRCGSSTSSCCSPTARSASSASSWSSSASAPGPRRWPASRC
jgi:multicomponent Na+:H+ antiporter subunit A